MAREIIVMRRLDHPNVLKLEALITAHVSSSLYLVFEYMDHDLLGLSSLPGVKFSEPQVLLYTARKCFATPTCRVLLGFGRISKIAHFQSFLK